MIKGLDIKIQIIKYIEENIGDMFHKVNTRDVFGFLTIIAGEIKANIGTTPN